MIELPKQLQDRKFRFIKVDNNKKPVELKWVKENNYRYDDPELKTYLKNAKSYGVNCGYGDLIIVDIENIEDKSVANLVISQKFPETFTVQTGNGGWHLYYFVSGIKKRIRLAKDEKHYGEIQAEGNQCIGPESIHPNGNKYKVLNNIKINTINKKELLEILAGFIEEEKEKKFTLTTGKGLNWDISKLIDYCPGLKEKDGIKWRGPHPVHGSTTGQNFEIDVEKNTWYCFRCDNGGDAVTLIAMLEGLVQIDEFCPTKEKFKQVFKKVKEVGIKKYGFPDDNYKPKHQVTVDKMPNLYIYDDKGKIIANNIAKVVEYFKQLNPTIVIDSITGKGAHIYVYKDGYYRLNGQTILTQFVKEIFKRQKKFWTSKYEKEIIHYINTIEVQNRNDFQVSENLINCNNKIYDLNTRKSRRHTPEEYFLYKIPWNYKVSSGLAPELKKYFDTTFNGNKEIIAFVQELFGYCLYSNYPHAGLFYLYGTGGNGKKVFMTLLEELLGEDNIANKSMNSLVAVRFATADLYGKLLNSCGELSGKILKETDMLKSLTSGDRIAAEFKGLDGFSFANLAKIVTACNTIPKSFDDSDGWYDRQFIIPFLRKFRYSKTEDTKLSKKLITKKNMESLLYWAIQGLHRLLKNEGFTYPKDKKSIYQMYQGNTKYFLQTNYERTFVQTDYVKVDDVRIHYEKWCKENNVPLDSDEALSRAFSYVFKRGRDDSGPRIELMSKNNKKIYVRYGLKKVK